MADPSPAPSVEIRLAKALSHPLRRRLLFEYGHLVTSPRRLADTLGAPLTSVSYHTQALLRHGCIELVRTEPRRGATEHFYRAIVGPNLQDAEWSRLPAGVRRELVASTLAEVWDDVRKGAEHGGFEPVDVHVSRAEVRLDADARAELNRLLQHVAVEAQRLHAASAARAGATTPSAVVVLHFDRPPGEA
jgi:DNA-binding transcriptional ArsR family regulator